MKKILVGGLILVAIILLAGGFFLLFRGEEDTWVCQNGTWQKHGNPSSPKPTEICPVEESPIPGVDTKQGEGSRIGGQTDEHGCITPAGYTWCESKGKCLRTWEEICP